MSKADNVVRLLRIAGRSGISAEELALKLGTDSSDLNHYGRNAIYEAKQQIPQLEGKIQRVYIENIGYKYYLAEVNRDALYDSICNTSEILRNGLGHNREGVEVIYEADEPMIILFLSDLHLGHKYCDYGLVKSVFDKISKYKNVFIVGLGDLIDNSLNALSPTGTMNLCDKDEQLSLIQYLFDKIDKRQILRMYEGNHELRSFISDRFLVSKWISLQYTTSYGFFGDPFIIEIGKKKWTFFCRHKPIGRSLHNPLYGCAKGALHDLAELARDADILVTAHTHTPGIGQWVVGGKMRYMISTAAPVDFDEYAERVGYVSGCYKNIPAVYLRENEEPQMFWNYEDALKDYGVERPSY